LTEQQRTSIYAKLAGLPHENDCNDFRGKGKPGTPGLAALFYRTQGHKVDYMIMEDSTRLSRERGELAKFINAFKSTGAKVVVTRHDVGDRGDRKSAAPLTDA